jgi:GDPmannose 4,6-dehydratase
MDRADDFIIATGEMHSVREFVQAAFKHIGKEIVWEGEGPYAIKLFGTAVS